MIDEQESGITVKQQFKQEYNNAMDTLIQKMSWHFEALSNITNDFDYLTGFCLVIL